MAREIKTLKLEVDQWDKTFQTATNLSAAESRWQSGEIGKLEESLKQARAAKVKAEGELKNEKTVVEDAKQTINELNQVVEKAKSAEDEAKKIAEEARKAAEEAQKTLQALEGSFKELEARVDVAEAKSIMAKDLLAQERVGLQNKLEDGEDSLVDTAMFKV